MPSHPWLLIYYLVSYHDRPKLQTGYEHGRKPRVAEFNRKYAYEHGRFDTFKGNDLTN